MNSLLPFFTGFHSVYNHLEQPVMPDYLPTTAQGPHAQMTGCQLQQIVVAMTPPFEKQFF